MDYPVPSPGNADPSALEPYPIDPQGNEAVPSPTPSSTLITPAVPLKKGTTTFPSAFSQDATLNEALDASIFSSYEKKTEESASAIKTITIIVDHGEAKNENFIRAHMKLSEGDPFNPHIADEAIHSLATINMFDDIRIVADQNDDGTVNLTLSMMTRPKIAAIEFPHEKVSNKKLKKEIKTVVGEYLNKAYINDDIQAIYRHYQIQGFPKPKIYYEILPTKDPKYVKVIFDILPGEGLHISKIEFTNFNDVDISSIRKKMLLKTWSFFSFLTKKGYLVDLFLDVDRQMIVEEMQNTGYLDAKVVDAVFKSNGKNSGTLQFIGDCGQKYFVGKVDFVGNKIYPNDKIALLIEHIKSGEAFSPEKVSATAEMIQNFYRYSGYINTYVVAEKTPTFIDNTIDVKFTIHESPLTYVNSVLVNGNYKTKNKVVLRELALAPGDKFNYIKMKNSENRLKNTGFFETVSMDATDSEIPDHKNIQIDVKEKNTGNVQIGGAISARNNQYVFFEISQSNFDLLGGPKAKFQGSGQKARARIQIGTRDNQLTLSFEEPYLFDRELAFGVDIFGEKTKYRTSDSNYSGPTYDETSFGMEPYFRKRLYELWVGRLAYNFTRKNIHNVSASAVQPIKDEAGWRSSSRVKFSVERDTRDNYIFPRTGLLVGIDTQCAGLGGQIKLFRTTAGVSKWITISEKYDHVLTIAMKMGMICPLANKQTPYSERHFLGGDSLMRGFEFREISPKVNRIHDKNNNSLGGNSFVYGCLEYTANIFDDFYLATFGEIGNVGKHQNPFHNGLNVDIGLGLRIFIMNMPLHLDWGYPLRATDGIKKKGVQFNFSFGASF
jgi:outer membrane protein insertion porin family